MGCSEVHDVWPGSSALEVSTFSMKNLPSGVTFGLLATLSREERSFEGRLHWKVGWMFGPTLPPFGGAIGVAAPSAEPAPASAPTVTNDAIPARRMREM